MAWDTQPSKRGFVGCEVQRSRGALPPKIHAVESPGIQRAGSQAPARTLHRGVLEIKQKTILSFLGNPVCR